MKLNNFLSIAGILALLFGLAFLFVPVQTMAMYGVTLDISGQYVARYLGSAFLGIGVLNWSARNAKPNDGGVRAIILVVSSSASPVSSSPCLMYLPVQGIIWSGPRSQYISS